VFATLAIIIVVTFVPRIRGQNESLRQCVRDATRLMRQEALVDARELQKEAFEVMRLVYGYHIEEYEIVYKIFRDDDATKNGRATAQIAVVFRCNERNLTSGGQY
jgi:hypothetical protein